MGRHGKQEQQPPTKEEAQAVADVIGHLSLLDQAGRVRVLRTAATFWGIGLNVRPQGGGCRTRGASQPEEPKSNLQRKLDGEEPHAPTGGPFNFPNAADAIRARRASRTGLQGDDLPPIEFPTNDPELPIEILDRGMPTGEFLDRHK